jgi:ABC-type lipoprotein release transport system permease subunit
MAAVWLRFRAELRSRWRAWLVLALMLGVASGIVIAAAAGARRTATAYERFLRDQHAFDAVVFPNCPGPDALPPGQAPPPCDVTAAAGLPIVSDATRVFSISADVFTADNRSLDPGGDPGYTGVGEVALVGGTSDGFGTGINRVRVIEGRRADANDPTEVTISAPLAERAGVEVGDQLHTNRLNFADGVRARLDFRVVGIEVSPYEIVPPSGEFLAVVHITPAAVRTVRDRGGTVEVGLAVRLVGGDAGFAELGREVLDRGIPGVVLFRQADQAKAVERAIQPEAVALAVGAVVGGLAMIAVFGSVLGRSAWAASDGLAVMWALGIRRRQLLALTLVRGAAIGMAAAVVAGVVAVALSPLTPIGLARDVEPSPGLAFNGAFVVFGALLTLVAVVLLLLWPAFRIARAASTARGVALRERPSALAALAARSVLTPSRVIGVRMALDPGRGLTAVPVRSGFVGVTIGVVAMSAAFGFSAGLTHLETTPRVLGYTWDALVYVGDAIPIEEAATRFRRLGEVENASIGTAPIFSGPFPDHPLLLGDDRAPVELVAVERGGVGAAVIEGRAPIRAHEILVGSETLTDLGLEVGDRLRAFGQVGDSDRPDALEDTSVSMLIVGTGAIPLAGGNPATASRIGRGAFLTMGGLRLLNPVFEPDVVFLQLSAGTSVESGLRAVRTVVRDAGGDPGSVFGDASPDLHDVLVITRVEALPLILAGLVGVLAAALLAHVLVTSVRTRRVDFAVLRALGFRRRELRSVVTAHATTIAVIALAIGLPLGALLGVQIWEAYARTIGVVPEGVVEPETLVVVAVAGLLVAGAVAAWPARAAARTRAAVALRSE